MFSIAAVLEYYGADGVPEGRDRPLRCPFHEDRQASGSVDTDKELYNCHGCPAGGDAIKLIMDEEGCDYETAVKRATEITGESDSRIPGRSSKQPGRSLLPQWARDRHAGSGTLPPWLRG